jgi:hypothetical protein
MFVGQSNLNIAYELFSSTSAQSVLKQSASVPKWSPTLSSGWVPGTANQIDKSCIREMCGAVP